MRPSPEHLLIETYFAPLAAAAAGAFGLKDDAARLEPTHGHDLVLTTDTLIADRHFFADDSADDIAWKALTVNISDLAAKGARPRGYLLNLALKKENQSWLEKFANGLKQAQNTYDCHLLGGDTVATDGPLTISITAIGEVCAGTMVRRKGAQQGDLVFVSGTIGDAAIALKLKNARALKLKNAGALKLKKDGALKPKNDGLHLRCLDDDIHHTKWLMQRLNRPQARVGLGRILPEYATAAMDISDGLAGDFAKLCAVSEHGGLINQSEIPLSKPLHDAVREQRDVWHSILTGGDDYEILATIPPHRAKAFKAAARKAGHRVQKIGVITKAFAEVIIKDESGQPVALTSPAFSHF